MCTQAVKRIILIYESLNTKQITIPTFQPILVKIYHIIIGVYDIYDLNILRQSVFTEDLFFHTDKNKHEQVLPIEFEIF